MSSGFRHVAIALLSILIWICGETLLAAVVSSPACLTNRRLAISKAHVLSSSGPGIQVDKRGSLWRGSLKMGATLFADWPLCLASDATIRAFARYRAAWPLVSSRYFVF
ncbi:hypothetical protein HDV62DRAFT_331762 [Trichoderma sp. SZMC 28011]